MWILWVVILLCAALWAAATRRRQKALLAKCNLTECRAAYLPFLGHALQFLGNSEHHMKTFRKLGKEATDCDGGVISYWMGNELYVGISDPSNAEYLLKSCLEKADLLKFFSYLTGNGSVFTSVDIWRPRRKIIVPTFSTKNLNWFADNVFVRQSETMARLLRARVGAGPFSLWPYLTSYTFDSICETFAEINLLAQEVPNIYLDYLEEATQIMAKRVVSPWLYSDMIFKLTTAYSSLRKMKASVYHCIQKALQSKMAEHKFNESEKSENDTPSFLERLQRTGKLSLLEICEEAIVFLVAGTDTSAVGSAFTALMLARHQLVQDKVYQELVEVFGDSERPVSAADLPRLRYLECVIKESLRLYPPVPVTMRKVDRDVKLPTGQMLPIGSTAVLLIEAVNRNPRYWGADAARFRPERFLDSSLAHPAQFMPFSYGPRNCVGYRYAMMSMKTALATLLRRFALLPALAPREAAPGTCLEEDQPLRTSFSIMMKDVDNFKVQLQFRSKAK